MLNMFRPFRAQTFNFIFNFQQKIGHVNVPYLSINFILSSEF